MKELKKGTGSARMPYEFFIVYLCALVHGIYHDYTNNKLSMPELHGSFELSGRIREGKMR